MTPPAPPGRVFTPPDFAARMWRCALDHLGQTPTTPRVLEPAAGAGALLRAGIDTGVAMEMTAIELAPDLVETLRADFADRARVVHADALVLGRGAVPNSFAGVAHGGLSTSTVAARWPDLVAGGTFDLAIGNPPYLRETGNRDVFRALRTWADGALAATYRKDCDLHHFFWEAAARQLRPGGILIFLTPAYFLESEAAAPLRHRLASGGFVEAVWRAGSASVFREAGVEAAVTVWRKAGRGHPEGTALLDAELRPTGRRVRLAGDGSPWWLDSALEIDALAELPRRLGELFEIREGVSTGANRLHARDAHLVPGANAGDGIFVLSAAEVDRLDADPAELRRFVRPRWGGARGDESILLVRDGDLERLDRDEPARTAVERHLERFRPVLGRRAEIARNPSRSWYAVAWPRAGSAPVGTLVTPKWARQPEFSVLPRGAVPMTDHRLLVPRADSVARAAFAVRDWLRSERLRPWLERRMKRKGEMIEWYGRRLAEIPVPATLD